MAAPGVPAHPQAFPEGWHSLGCQGALPRLAELTSLYLLSPLCTCPLLMGELGKPSQLITSCFSLPAQPDAVQLPELPAGKCPRVPVSVQLLWGWVLRQQWPEGATLALRESCVEEQLVTRNFDRDSLFSWERCMPEERLQP